MSMSTHIVGFRPADERWQQMKAARAALVEAGLKIPAEIEEFFNWEEPDPQGVEVDLERAGVVRPWKDDMREGFEVDLRGLPPEVNVIRFYNSW